MGPDAPWPTGVNLGTPVTSDNCGVAPLVPDHWWPGDGNANDIVGGANGTLQNGATATVAGKVGQQRDHRGSHRFDGAAEPGAGAIRHHPSPERHGRLQSFGGAAPGGAQRAHERHRRDADYRYRLRHDGHTPRHGAEREFRAAQPGQSSRFSVGLTASCHSAPGLYARPGEVERMVYKTTRPFSPIVVSSSIVSLPCGQSWHLPGLYDADKLVPR